MAQFYVWKVKILRWVYNLIVTTIRVGTVVNLIITILGHEWNTKIAQRESNAKNNFPRLHGVNQNPKIIFPACTVLIKYQQ